VASSDELPVYGGTEFIVQLRQLVATYIREQPLQVEQAAELAGISARTLQRRLSAEGLSYSALVDQVMFDIASELLLETDMKVIEVAREVGCDDPSHFSRAFRRLSGLAPRRFRQIHTEPDQPTH
jgi:AraC-like DNA-binding protein